jgi:hypothetical protein
MKETSWSAEAERILRNYLVKEGKGRELFPADATEEVEHSPQE